MRKRRSTFLVAPSVVASSLFDFDPPDSTSDNNDTWLRGSPEHEAHAVDNDRVVDVRQRFEKEEKHVPDDVVAPRVVIIAL